MKLNEKIQDALNKQINAELYSAYLYLSIAAYFESKNLKGFAQWMKVQSNEEYSHAMKIYSYLHERGGMVTLTTIPGPETIWSSPLKAFEDAYSHEVEVTAMIDKLVSLARMENDYATESMLTWFVDEQVEEEAYTSEIVQKMRLLKDAPTNLLFLDHELGKRKKE